MIKKLSFVCVIFSLIFLSLAIHSYAFSDDFTSTELNTENWALDLNGGNAFYDGNSLRLVQGINTKSPYLRTNNFTLATGREIEIKFKLVGPYNYGAGIVFYDSQLANGIPTEHAHARTLLQIWPSGGGKIGLYALLLCDESEIDCSRPYRLLTQYQYDAEWHILKVTQSLSNVYSVYLDGVKFLESRPTDISVGSLWFGNPEITGSAIRPWIEIDYVHENAGDTEVSPQVPDLKQYDSGWGEQIYDNAPVWSPETPTIRRWGCALTSASMILNYFNHSIDPGDLNQWLLGQLDGYIRNGSLNWLAVSRYSKINRDEDSPNLEFTRAKVDNGLLDSTLADERPVILGEPGHFVVATEKSGETYLINDPGFDDRPTLASYDNGYTSQSVYTPSNTDLSYMMLVINEDVDISIKDSEDNLVGDIFKEELIDQTDGSSNGGLNVYYFPKPEDGDYVIRVSGGEGLYQLDSYLYDTDGEVAKKTFQGVLSGSDEEEYQIMLGEDDEIDKKIGIDGMLADLEKLYQMKLLDHNSYNLIKKQLLIMKKLEGKRVAQTGVKLLTLSLKRQIQLLSSRLISTEAEAVLLEDLEGL